MIYKHFLGGRNSQTTSRQGYANASSNAYCAGNIHFSVMQTDNFFGEGETYANMVTIFCCPAACLAQCLANGHTRDTKIFGEFDLIKLFVIGELTVVDSRAQSRQSSQEAYHHRAYGSRHHHPPYRTQIQIRPHPHAPRLRRYRGQARRSPP